jgi:hypothetical protein
MSAKVPVFAIDPDFLVLTRALKVVLMISIVPGCASTDHLKPHAPLVSSEQSEIVLVVAEDFAMNPDCDYGTGESGIVVNSNVGSSSGLVSDEWLGRALDAQMWSQIAPLSPQLRAANPRSRLVDWGISDRPDMVVRDMSMLDQRQIDKLASKVRCFATFMLPAISSEGDDALVAFYVGPSPHGAVALYALKRGASGWVIAGRGFFHFL